MATFIRRGLTKLVEQRQQPKPAALVFSRTEGAVTLNAREASRYGMLMAMLDSDEDDQIGGMEGASFLRRSGLDTGEESEEWPPMPPPSTGRRRRRSRRRSRRRHGRRRRSSSSSKQQQRRRPASSSSGGGGGLQSARRFHDGPWATTHSPPPTEPPTCRPPTRPSRRAARDVAPRERRHEQDAPDARGLLRGLQARRSRAVQGLP